MNEGGGRQRRLLVLLQVGQVEQMHRAVVGRDADERRVLVEVDAEGCRREARLAIFLGWKISFSGHDAAASGKRAALNLPVDVGGVRAAPQLVQQLTGGGVEHAHQRALLRGGRQLRAAQVQADAAERRLVRGDLRGRLVRLGQVDQLDVADRSPREGQQRVVRVRTEHAQALRVGAGVERLQVLRRQREGVDLNGLLQHDHDPVAAQSDALHVAGELQLDHVLLLQVVPDHHWRRIGAKVEHGEVEDGEVEDGVVEDGEVEDGEVGDRKVFTEVSVSCRNGYRWLSSH